MANRIAGITAEINGSTTGLSKALESVNKTIKNKQAQLKDVERLLKLDPVNGDLTDSFFAAGGGAMWLGTGKRSDYARTALL